MKSINVIKRIGIFVLVFMIVSVIAGCGKVVGDLKEKLNDSADSSSTSEASQTQADEDGSGSADGTAEDGDGTGDEGQGDEGYAVDDLSSLETYHHLTEVWTEGEDSPSNTIEEYCDIPNNARHVITTMYIDGQEMVIEAIRIGNKSWQKMPGLDSWYMQESSEDYDIGQDDITAIDASNWDENDLEYLGKETKNGFNCKKYKTSLEDANASQTCTIWIADQADLPKVQISMLNELTPKNGENAGKLITMKIDLLEINQPVDIQPPENVQDE